LSFQNLDDELRDIAAKYCAPEGELVVAIDGNEVLGMVAYHRHSDARCEMKRMFVYPQYREKGIGAQLAGEIVQRAKLAGYTEMVLDTLVPLKPAIALYKRMGFEECEAYYHNPLPDVIYMRKSMIE